MLYNITYNIIKIKVGSQGHNIKDRRLEVTGDSEEIQTVFNIQHKTGISPHSPALTVAAKKRHPC